MGEVVSVKGRWISDKHIKAYKEGIFIPASGRMHIAFQRVWLGSQMPMAIGDSSTKQVNM